MTVALVVEDVPDNMVLITDVLELNGYSVLQAETGMQGVDVAVSKQPDLVLLDIQLPDIDGYEVLDRLRADPRTQTIPVIAVTSYAMAGDRQRLLSAGCNGYIEKPINPSLLMKQIQQVLKAT